MASRPIYILLMQETLSKVLDAKVNKIRICARSKRWWNGELKERRNALGRENRRGKRSAAAAHTTRHCRGSFGSPSAACGTSTCGASGGARSGGQQPLPTMKREPLWKL